MASIDLDIVELSAIPQIKDRVCVPGICELGAVSIQRFHRSFGSSPVHLEMRASMRGSISSRSWKANM